MVRSGRGVGFSSLQVISQQRELMDMIAMYSNNVKSFQLR